MITAHSRAIDTEPGEPMMLLAMDAAVVSFRRRVAEAIAAQSGSAAAAPGRRAAAKRSGNAPGGAMDRLRRQHLGGDGTLERRTREA